MICKRNYNYIIEVDYQKSFITVSANSSRTTSISPSVALKYLDALVLYLQQDGLDTFVFLDYIHKIYGHNEKKGDL